MVSCECRCNTAHTTGVSRVVEEVVNTSVSLLLDCGNGGSSGMGFVMVT